MLAYIRQQAEKIGDMELRELCLLNLNINEEKLIYYPAASKNHHAERSGLLWHIKRMLMSGIALCDVYTNLNKDLLVCGIILHDIEKLTEIESDENGISPGYSFEGIMLGHIVQGVKVLDRQMSELDFPEEKKIMVEHMILSHHCEPEYGSPKRPLFPEAEMLHFLDNLDAKMFDFEDVLEKTKPGEFSDRVWTLNNRRLYKPANK
jgi:3'-5' exoribonuclease